MNLHRLAAYNLIANVEGNFITRGNARSNLYYVSVIERNRDLVKGNLVFLIDDGDDGSTRPKYQRGGRNLNQARFRNLKADINIHSRHQHMFRIGNIHLDPQGTSLRIDCVRGAGDLSVKYPVLDTVSCNLCADTDFKLAGRILRNIGENADRIVQNHMVERTGIRTATGRDQIADIDAALRDRAAIGRHHLLELC